MAARAGNGVKRPGSVEMECGLGEIGGVDLVGRVECMLAFRSSLGDSARFPGAKGWNPGAFLAPGSGWKFGLLCFLGGAV